MGDRFPGLGDSHPLDQIIGGAKAGRVQKKKVSKGKGESPFEEITSRSRVGRDDGPVRLEKAVEKGGFSGVGGTGQQDRERRKDSAVFSKKGELVAGEMLKGVYLGKKEGMGIEVFGVGHFLRIVKKGIKGCKQIEKGLFDCGKRMVFRTGEGGMGRQKIPIGRCRNHPVERFGLEEGDLPVLIGAQGKFSRFCLSDSALFDGMQNGSDVLGVSMSLNLDHIFAGKGMRGGKKKDKDRVDRLSLLF